MGPTPLPPENRKVRMRLVTTAADPHTSMYMRGTKSIDCRSSRLGKSLGIVGASEGAVGPAVSYPSLTLTTAPPTLIRASAWMARCDFPCAYTAPLSPVAAMAAGHQRYANSEEVEDTRDGDPFFCCDIAEAMNYKTPKLKTFARN